MAKARATSKSLDIFADRQHDWPVTLRLGQVLREQIDDWRRWQKDIPGRAEAVRRLIEIALHVEKRT